MAPTEPTGKPGDAKGSRRPVERAGRLPRAERREQIVAAATRAFAGSGSTVSAAPTTITASNGSSQSTITVTARDAFGNPIAGATVVLAATGTGNTLTQPAGTTSASGVATGTLSSTVAEIKTVSATVDGLGITQTAAVTVDPAAAAQLLFTQQPTDEADNTAISPPVHVSVRDQFGNVVTGFASAIDMTITPGTGTAGAVLSGTMSRTPASGVAFFDDLKIDFPGVS